MLPSAFENNGVHVKDKDYGGYGCIDLYNWLRIRNVMSVNTIKMAIKFIHD